MIMFLLQIIAVVFGLGFLVFIHELGHFSVAKFYKVKIQKRYPSDIVTSLNIKLTINTGKSHIVKLLFNSIQILLIFIFSGIYL